MIETARLTIVRQIEDDGRDLVSIENVDLIQGGRIGVVEALGMLELAKWDVCNATDDDDDDQENTE